MKKILVIDGNSIINRAFYGVKPLTTKSGKFTNAIYGMINIISRQMDAVKPDYAAVAFDLKHPTFRHDLYPEYKAGRHATPEELKSQFPDAKECLKLMGISILELPGWEADDIQGTVAKWAHSHPDTKSYVLSGDRDLLQLIDERVTVLLATNHDTLAMTEAEFSEKYGIRASQFVDMKALMGDSSDNIPGVAGIGEKTAATLIGAFGSLEGIYENIDSPTIKKGVREKLIAGKENAFLSRTLAKIDTDAPLGLTLEDISYKGPDKAGLYRKFTELELNSFITKFHLDAPDTTAECKDIFTEEESTEYCELSRDELGRLDTGRLSISISEDKTVYLSTEKNNYIYKGELSELSSVIPGRVLITYDAKALYHKLADAGIDLARVTFLDLLMYEYAINPGGGMAGIPSLSSMFLGRTVTAGAPATHLYSELEGALLRKIKADGLERILFDIELPLIRVLAECERVGFKINRRGIEEFGEALGVVAEELSASIYEQAGEVFNINSPKQLGEILFVKLGLGAWMKKGKNGYHTDAQTLEELRQESPIIDDILEYRQVMKLKGTYTTALTSVADEGDRIHTDFKQAQTATGRLSSAEPNLQNIPIRTKMGRELRRFFISEEGYTLIDADYSQIELRLLAHISGDYTMTEAFRSGEDIHRKTAAAVFNVPEEFVTEEMRKKAKAVNFGIVYGIGGYSLSKDIGTTVAEASSYIKSYLMNYPDVDRYLDAVVKEAEELGYTTTMFGRRRYIPELKAAKAPLRAFGKRVAMNAPIQGAAADIMKLAMIKVYQALKRECPTARIVMQVHDELVIEARDEDVELCSAIVRREMENAVALSVPLTVDVTSGKNWLEQS